MAPDTQDAVLKINTKMVTAIISVIMFCVGAISWFTRLEYRTETNRDEQIKLAAAIETVRNDRARDESRITRAESQLTFILQGIEEIKVLLRDRDRRTAP